MKKMKQIRLVVTLIIIGLFIWFLVLSPYITFKKNERTMLEAAKRYYELNSDKLPTGTRMSTVTLQTLSRESYIKEDFYVPFSKKPCSITKSWVKVKHTDSGYKYYTYLQCGVLKSTTDHTGPVITLNGSSEITINKGDTYKEPGVKKVVDNTDGKIDVKEVEITGKVNTSKVGTYTITYSVMDSFKNETVKKRTVKVVQQLKNTVEKATKTGLYVGEVTNNYIKFSGMNFRIVGVVDGNVKIASAEDIANVNYSDLDEWLKYYYEHIDKDSKDYVVKTKYCNDTLTDTSTKECSKYTDEKYVYILSVQDINNATDDAGNSYLYPETIDWVANAKTNKESWTTREYFSDSTSKYMEFSKDYNFGIRPVLTIKGDALITSGDGTSEKPYMIDDYDIGTSGDKVNTRLSGEFIEYSNMLWQIIETTDSSLTKVISYNTMTVDSLRDISYPTGGTKNIYNPNKKGNIGYIINQKASDAIDEKYFVKTEIEVPIYKTLATYKGTSSTKKYNVKFHAPNMYEMHTARNTNTQRSYWLMNSSNEEYRRYIVSEIGVVFYEKEGTPTDAGTRIVGYLDKNCQIVQGQGTKDNPYKITK